MPSLNATCQRQKESTNRTTSLNYGTAAPAATTKARKKTKCICEAARPSVATDDHDDDDDVRCIDLVHSEEAQCRVPLLDNNNHHWLASCPYYEESSQKERTPAKAAAAATTTTTTTKKLGHQQDNIGRCSLLNCSFRYWLALLILAAISVNSYANYTLYIAAIEMVSNDFVSSRLTELRRQHMSNDPLMMGHDAGAPGTCPVATSNNLAAISRLKTLLSNSAASASASASAKPPVNLTAIGLHEQQALALDTLALFATVRERLAAGQLVDWSISERAYMFTAHNIGGILLSVPISRLGLVYGSKQVIGWCLALASARMLLLPVLAASSPYWLVFMFEFLLGAPGSCVAILAYPLAAAWLLPDEANFFVALGHFGQLIGNALTNFVSTQLMANHISWPYCFYLPGVCLTLLTVLWLVFGADEARQSGFVSPAERALIDHQSLATINHLKLMRAYRQGQQQQQQQQLVNQCFCSPDPEQRNQCPANRLVRRPHWSTILSCPTVWALVMAFFAYHWNAKVATLWPTYFANILHLDAATIGILTGLKGVVALLFGSLFAFFTRRFAIERPFGMSLTGYRRANQLLAALVMAASVALMCLLDCDVWAVFASVMLTPVISSFNAISHEQMPLDLSAEDSGLLVSVIRLISIGDIPALPVSSYILSYAPQVSYLSAGGGGGGDPSGAATGDRNTWRLVWLVGLLIKVVACAFFMLVAKSEPKRYSSLEPAGPCKTLPAP